MRNIKSIFIGLFIAIIILVTTAITVSYFYEDQVSQYLIEELNEYLLAEIETEDISFSLLKKFPQASLEFKNAMAYSKEGFYSRINGYNTDTLFFAKSIYVQINLFDLISKDITIKSIHFDQGVINLFVDHLGDPNYIFWDKNQKDTLNNEARLNLDEVKITDSELFYYNDVTKLLLSTHLNKLEFEGNFSSKNYLMKIRSEQFVKKLNIEDINYVFNKKLKAKLGLDIIENLVKINNGDLNLENLHFNVNGSLESGKSLDLLISGNNLNIRNFIQNLPTKVVEEFPNIIGQKGTATVSLNVSGDDIKNKKPHIEALFFINNAQLFDLERDIRILNVNIDGEFTNGNQNISESSKIVFKSFDARLESNVFEGNFELRNFRDPQIKLDLNSELYLNEIKEIFKIDTIDILKGYVNSNIKYIGNYNELRAFQFRDLFTKDYNVSLDLSDGEFKFKNQDIILKDVSGKIELNRTLKTDSLYFKVNNNDFLIKGRISKLFEYFNEKDMFNINAQVYSRKLNLDELSPLFRKENSDNKESYQFPEKVALQLRLNIENFEVGKFYATNIRGNLNYKPKMFSLHQISFNSMNGNIKVGGVIIQNYKNDFVVRTQSRLTNINMNKLFYSFNNFGQSFITNQNLEGNLTGDVYFSSEWNDKIEIYKNTVNSECEITLSDGVLNNFEPMLGLSRFIDIDELKKVKFSTITNTITIKDEEIVIPQMDIESSAINVTASGTHHFNSNYEYHVKMLLSDLLSSKFRKSKKNRKDAKNIEEDREGRAILYLLIEGDKDKSRVKYDRKTARSERKENLKKEKSELKEILKEEYGWYKKDSTIQSQEKDNNQDFEIDFEEEEKDENSKNLESDQKFIIEWEEDTTDN